MGPIEAIDQVDRNITAFRDRMTLEAKQTTVTALVDQERAKYTTQGLTGPINVAPAALLEELASQAAAQYDAQRRDEGTALEQEIASVAAGLETVIMAAMQLPDPIRMEDATPAGETQHEMRRVRLMLEADRTERHLTGKTLGQIADMYAEADDRLDHVLKHAIEKQARLGWRDIAIANNGDVGGAMKLQAAITAAQRARLEREQPALVKAEAKLKTLRSSAVLDNLLRHLRSGRGLSLAKGA
jgi:hypothetical protein